MMPDDAFTELNFGTDEESLAAIVNLQRGLVMSAYANVEFVVTDFVVRCSNIIQYGSVMPPGLPYSMERRLKISRDIFVAPGPFMKYQAQMLPLIDRLLSFENLRHMMVHGLMILYHNPQDVSLSKIVFRRYDFGKKKSLLLFNAEITLQDLAERQLEITRFSCEVVRQMYGILNESDLPAPVMTEAGSTQT